MNERTNERLSGRTNDRAYERQKECTIIKLNIELLVINILCRTQVNNDG